MNGPAENQDRARVADALRQVARFFEENPTLPVPDTVEIYHSVRDDCDESERQEINRIAEILGVRPEHRNGTAHYCATRKWGSVSYRAVAITQAEMRRFHASMSYVDVVITEEWPI